MIGKCKRGFGKMADAVGEHWSGIVKQCFFPVGDPDKVYDLEQVSLPLGPHPMRCVDWIK